MQVNDQTSSATAEKIDATQKILDQKLEKANDGISSIVGALADLASKSDDVQSTPSKCVSPVDIKLILSQVTELVEDLSSFRAEMASIKDDIVLFKQQQASELTKLKNDFNSELRKLQENQKKEIKQLKKITNANNQYPRLNNAVLHNFHVPSREEWNVSYTERVAWQLNEYLPMLDVPLNKYNIDITHPLRNNTKGQPVVIIRLVNRHIRNNILDHAFVLERYGIFASEHLTRQCYSPKPSKTCCWF